MSAFWSRIRDLFWSSETEPLPGQPRSSSQLSDSQPQGIPSSIPEADRCEVQKEPILSRMARTIQMQLPEFPRTYNAGLVGGAADQGRVFDPALSHFSRGFRPGNPAFHDLEVGKRWYAARHQVMLHLLELIGNSPWHEHLVLRGSLVLEAWLGDEARVPGDMDWVVTPHTTKVTDAWSSGLFPAITELVRQSPRAGSVQISATNSASDEIWTYDRAPGRRIVYPWEAPDMPPGSIQLDFVFEEELWSAPIQTRFPTLNGGQVAITTASPEMSLAWKLQWLLGDVCPQGKDLYDATLLAERTRLPKAMLQRVYREAGLEPPLDPNVNFTLDFDADWDNFKLEYPWIVGDANEWHARLRLALAKNS